MKINEAAVAYGRGMKAMTDYHLISSTGNVSINLAKEILTIAGNIYNLSKWNADDFMRFKGVGKSKALALVSAFELGRRRLDFIPEKPIKIISSKNSYDVLKSELLDQQVELFYAIYLKANATIIKKQKISQGGISATTADPKLIFKYALECGASAIILAHNHPSGNIKPSDADIRLTKKLVQAGRTMEISILDHIIFTDEKYFSFADESML